MRPVISELHSTATPFAEARALRQDARRYHAPVHVLASDVAILRIDQMNLSNTSLVLASPAIMRGERLTLRSLGS